MAFAEEPVKTTAIKSVAASPVPARPSSPEPAGRRFRFLDGLLVLVVLLFAFLTALFPVYNGDFFLHAATGRLIAHGQYQIGVDPFAFTTQGAVWINQHWLYDLIVYLLYSISPYGGTILVVLKALMVAALAGVMLRAAREPGRSLWIPAVCVGLAVLTLSPRVFLQPACVSFFFLGLTLWLLLLPRRLRARTGANASPRRPFLPYWLIPPLCLLWVNIDEWFLLGPATVALYLLGETLQGWFGPVNAADAPAPSGERRTLLLVLVVSVAVCLINPHHFRAFALPQELGLSEAADVLHNDIQFRALSLMPTEGLYFYPGTGLSVAGLAYFPLALLGIVSFAATLGMGGWRWGRVLLWAAFFALSLGHARAIPFFAVVAGPITSLNFLDFAAKCFSSTKTIPNAWALGGRLLTLLAGLALLALSWPGWLQAQPWESRRAGWDVVANPALKQLAEQIAIWQKNELIPPDSRWFNTSPDVLYYLAWYCPGQRAFIDNQRLSLYNRTTAADFAALRKSLARDGGDAASADPKWRKILRVHDAHLLIWYEGRPFPLLPMSPLPTLLGNPQEWPLLSPHGRAAAFGWREPASEDKPNPFAQLEFDSNKVAFGPDAAAAPAEPPPAKPREWWSAYLTAEAPRPPDADEAALQWLRFQVLMPLWRQRNEKKWDALWDQYKHDLQTYAAAACFGSNNALTIGAIRRVLMPVEVHSPMPSIPPRPGEEMQAAQARKLFDMGPPDAVYLGIRAARRALAVKSDDAPSYQYLAQNYTTLAQQTREGVRSGDLGYPLLLRRVQIAAALRRALEWDPNLETAHALSAQFYLETGFVDLARDHAEKQQAVLLQSPDASTRRQAEAMGKEIAKLGKEITERQTTYQLHAAGQPVLGKVKAALELGLGQTALELLEKVDWHSFAKDDPNQVLGVQKEMTLLMQTGRADEVGKTLMDDEQNLKDGLGVDPETGLPTYEWLRVQVAAANGDYSEGDRWLKAIQEKTRRSPQLIVMFQRLGLLGPNTAEVADLEPSALTALLVGRLVLREAAPAAGAPWLRSPLPDAGTLLMAAAGAITEPLGRQADLETMRGWLALEAGNTVEARQRFNDALRLASPGNLPFRGRPLTQLDLEWLDGAK